jgi:hypothetical protein
MRASPPPTPPTAGIDSVNEPCGAFFRLTPSSHVQSAESSMQPAAFAIAIALK